MNGRPNLHEFAQAARDAFETFAKDDRSLRSIGRIFSAAKFDGVGALHVGTRPAFCEQYLGEILHADYGHTKLNRLMKSFADIENFVHWRPRPASNNTASENFPDNHANGMVIGPGGIVEHKSIMIGASFLAPNVRYPDHDHAPEETYLIMTEGEFRQGDKDWFSPGRGGSFYNPHGIKHAMRSGKTPLFAFWVLYL